MIHNIDYDPVVVVVVVSNEGRTSDIEYKVTITNGAVAFAIGSNHLIAGVSVPVVWSIILAN